VNTSIANLAALWESVSSLCADLDEAAWKTPTGCPGWSVQDHVAHLVDYESRALGRPGPDHQLADDAPHAKNDIGRFNEIGVDFRRARTGAEVLEEFREVTAARVEQLQALTDEDLSQPTQTPVGEGTVADMLVLRVMDTWTHEQDIRRAVGRPGNEKGPAVEEAVAYFTRALPFVVGKRAAAPEGSSVVFRIGGVTPVGVAVVEGRGRLVDELPHSPTVELRMPATTFVALVGGRSDAPDDVEITGDTALGERVVGAMGFMP